jgi:Glycosyltransferase family 87
MNWRKSIPSLVLSVVWLATRAALYLHATVPGRDGDVGLYQRWYACCFAHGTFPKADPMWQYPPGAALVFWLPGRLPGSYVDHFMFLAIGCDLAITLMLCWSARRGGSLAGAWYWVCGVPLLGPVIVGRFDVVPVALCVAALCVTGRGGVRGALIGAGAAVKLWPVALLAGMAPGQWRRGLAAAAAVLAAVCAIFPSATASFLAHQNARGVEIESVVATPFMIWRQAGWHGTVVYRFGAYQLSGGHVALALDASRLGLVLATAAVIGWRLLIAGGRARWRPEFAADAPLAATLLFLVASPVLSPQYLLWVTGLAAACLATGHTTQRPAALAVLAAAGLTQLIFPIGWYSLINGSDAVTGVLAARNLLLAVAAALSCWRILSVTSLAHEDSDQVAPRTASRPAWRSGSRVATPRQASRTGRHLADEPGCLIQRAVGSGEQTGL